MAATRSGLEADRPQDLLWPPYAPGHLLGHLPSDASAGNPFLTSRFSSSHSAHSEARSLRHRSVLGKAVDGPRASSHAS